MHRLYFILLILFYSLYLGSCKKHSTQTSDISTNSNRIYLTPVNKGDNTLDDLDIIAQRFSSISYFRNVKTDHDGTKYWLSFNLEKDFNKQLKVVISFLIEIKGNVFVRTVVPYPADFFKKKRSSMISVDKLGRIKVFKSIYRSVLEKFINTLTDQHEFFIYQERKGITEFSGRYNYAVLVGKFVEFERIEPDKLKISGRINQNMAVLLDSLIIKFVNNKKIIDIDSRLIPKRLIQAILNHGNLQTKWNIHQLIVDRKF